MPDDQDQSQSSGGLEGIASSIGKGLTKALPYALDIGLGAALGGPVGAAAGLARGMGTSEEKAQQQDVAMRQEELGMRWKQFQLESQQAQIAMNSAKSWQDYVNTLPDDQRALALENPSDYTKNKIESGSWNLGLETLKKDPSLGAKPDVIDAIEQLGPTAGKPMLEAYMKAATSGKFSNGVHSITQADGTTQLLGVGADGKPTVIASGIAPAVLAAGVSESKPLRGLKTIYGPNGATQQVEARAGYTPPPGWTLDKPPAPSKPPSPESLKLKATTALASYKTLAGAPPGTLGKLWDSNAATEWKDGAVSYLKSIGIPDDVANNAVSSIPGLAPSSSKKTLGGPRGATASAKLPVAPKELWGKTVTKDGKQYKIDSMGRATAL